MAIIALFSLPILLLKFSIVSYILKATSDAEESEQVYSMVEDDDELAAVAGVFENMLDDVDLI